MIRPTAFGANSQTANSNRYQHQDQRPAEDIQAAALAEFDAMASALQKAGVRVIVFADQPEPAKPDAVFPNNWVSTHSNGDVVLYPLAAENRRAERRLELIAALEAEHGFRIGRILDLSPGERDGRFLEGTGSLVFDRTRGWAYAGLSSRTQSEQLQIFAAQTGFVVHSFETSAADGLPVYHTNVMLSIGNRFALVCPDIIVDQSQRQQLLEILGESERDLIAITPGQMAAFAGNVLEVQGADDQPIILLSQAALKALDNDQRRRLECCGPLLPVSIETIERVGGGGVRCMLAEIFLPRAG